MGRRIQSVGGPKCPNHGCPLKDLGFPPKRVGTGVCPVSGVSFDYEQEIDEQKQDQEIALDKDGNKIKVHTYIIEGND